jgi:hypothetical protein
MIEETFTSWENLKSKKAFITIDPDNESEKMSIIEKLISGDPKDDWLKAQEIPFTEGQLNENWYSIRCLDGGAIWTCESLLELVNTDDNLNKPLNSAIIFTNCWVTFVMETKNNEQINSEICKICKEYQEERRSGRWYITTTELNKISKILSGKYFDLTTNQKRDYTVLSAVVTLILCAIIVYFGRICFPENFHTETVSFFENYWVLTLGLCFVVGLISICILVLWWIGCELVKDVKLLFR